jgi:hypothetical protein
MQRDLFDTKKNMSRGLIDDGYLLHVTIRTLIFNLKNTKLKDYFFNFVYTA